MHIPNSVSVTKKITWNTSISTPGITISYLLELTSNKSVDDSFAFVDYGPLISKRQYYLVARIISISIIEGSVETTFCLDIHQSFVTA
jgi:hypothetical protein